MSGGVYRDGPAGGFFVLVPGKTPPELQPGDENGDRSNTPTSSSVHPPLAALLAEAVATLTDFSQEFDHYRLKLQPDLQA